MHEIKADFSEILFPHVEKALKAYAVSGAILDLTIAGKLDAIDLRIISARDCSPMPAMREVARTVGLSISQANRRMRRIKALVIKEL